MIPQLLAFWMPTLPNCHVFTGVDSIRTTGGLEAWWKLERKADFFLLFTELKLSNFVLSGFLIQVCTMMGLN